MAVHFLLTLDTTAPDGLSLSINDGAAVTENPVVTLSLSTRAGDTAKMKIWGVEGAETEADAPWEPYAVTKTVRLPKSHGMKTVYARVMDDVGNYARGLFIPSGSDRLITADGDVFYNAPPASAGIYLDLSLPVVTTTGPDRSSAAGNSSDKINISFVSSRAFAEYKVCAVKKREALESEGAVIPISGGSVNTGGSGSFPANTAVYVTVTGADLAAAAGSGKGVKIIKVFVRDLAGNWSVA